MAAMRLSAGVVFMLGAFVLGLAALAGGQAWVLSGSLAAAAAVGAVAGLALAGALRWFLRRARASVQVRFLGERTSAVNEGEFHEVDDSGPEVRAALARDVRQRPERVAGSVRSMLGRGADRRN
ncbi:MAG: hypothetical protein ABIL09_08570 [Gemmatimonadota bacterium]